MVAIDLTLVDVSERVRERLRAASVKQAWVDHVRPGVYRVIAATYANTESQWGVDWALLLLDMARMGDISIESHNDHPQWIYGSELTFEALIDWLMTSPPRKP